jgi:hypothetical protein
MLRILAVLLALCGAAHSEESGPRESERKTEATQSNNGHDGGYSADDRPVGNSMTAAISVRMR